MSRISDIWAQVASGIGHIIRKVSAGGTDEMPNRPYLDFAGNCDVESTEDSVKVTIPNVPAGQVTVGETHTLEAGSLARVEQRGTPENRTLDFFIPTGPQGPQGEKGDPAQVRVGRTRIVEPGGQVSVSNVGTPTEVILNFSLPGGIPGPAGTISVGQVLTLPPDQPASITNVGTSENSILDFGIPQGQAATVNVGSTRQVASSEPAAVRNTGTLVDAILDFDIPQGRAATVSVGQVSSVDSTASATVTNVGTDEDAILDFGIPRGVTPDIQIGDVTTLAYDEQARVERRGTDEEPIFDFYIPMAAPVEDVLPVTLGGTAADTVEGARESLNVYSTEEVDAAIADESERIIALINEGTAKDAQQDLRMDGIDEEIEELQGIGEGWEEKLRDQNYRLMALISMQTHTEAILTERLGVPQLS